MIINTQPVFEALLKAKEDLAETDIEISEATNILARRVLALRSSLRRLSVTEPKPDANQLSEVLQMVGVVEETVNLLDSNLQGNTARVMYEIDGAFDAMGALRQPEVHALTDAEVRRQVLAMTDGRCTYCATIVSDTPVDGQSVKLFVEHVVPASKGGPNHLVNYVPSCGSCNSAKGDRHVLHFVRNVQPRRQEVPSVVSIVRAAE